MTATRFDPATDMGYETMRHLTICEQRHRVLVHIVATGHARLGLRTPLWQDSERDRRAVTELMLNALQHTPRHYLECPWSFTAERVGDDVVWKISDTGPGILRTYLDSFYGPHMLGVHGGDEDALLLHVIHERASCFASDPGAGLGMGIAIKRFAKQGGSATLRTEGRRLEMHEGRMVHVGPDETIGTHWTIRLPMAARTD